MPNDDDKDWEYCEGKRLQLRPHPTARREPWRWSSIAAVFGLAVGLASLGFGALADAAGWLGGVYGPLLLRVGTLLLIISVPLLAAGAHCLDLEERHAAGRHARGVSSGATKGER